jgi:cystathionine beta-lyase
MNFNEMIDRQNTESVKWNWFEKDVLPMWVADMDFRSPESVVNALHARVEHGVFGYGLPPAGLSEILIRRMHERYGWQVSESELAYVPGIVTGFNLAVRAVCQPGDAVIFNTPAYPPFFKAPQYANLTAVANPLYKDSSGHYEIDFDLFEHQISSNQVKAYILCNPQNPTGRVFTRTELEKLAEICLRHNVIICSDEIHCDIVYDQRRHIPIASLAPEVSQITMTFMAPSKTYNIAGLHASEVIIQNAELNKRYRRTRAGISEDPNILALVAAKAAYEAGEEWLQQALEYLQANRNWLEAQFAQRIPGIRMAHAEGTFLAWLDCTGLGLEENPQKFFLEKARVGMNDGLDFGDEGARHVRMNFGTPRANLELAIQRMESALMRLQQA